MTCKRTEQTRYDWRTAALVALLVTAVQPSATGAQNPISSKVVGSSVAAENRLNNALLREGAAAATDPDTQGQRRGILASSVVQLSNRQVSTKELPVSSNLPTAKQWLDSLHQKVPGFKELVEEALTLEGAALQGGLISRNDNISDATAGRALARLLQAKQNGHINPERWYVGGQVGLPLFGGDGLGTVMRASARAAYFVPISPFRGWQLPIVTNLGDLTAGQKDSDKEKVKKLVASSDGAYIALEPTWDPIYRSRLGDLRLQPFLSIGGQVNQLKAKDDTSTTVSFGQGRFGAGANLELGRKASGQSVIFLTSKVVASVFGAKAHEQVFGARRKSRTILESYALLPIGGSTALLVESTVGRGSAPVLRIGLWSQASAQKSTTAAAATSPEKP